MTMSAAGDVTYSLRFGGNCLECYRACVEPSGFSAMEVKRDPEGSFIVRPQTGSISAIADPEDFCVGVARDHHRGPAYRRLGSPGAIMNQWYGCSIAATEGGAEEYAEAPEVIGEWAQGGGEMAHTADITYGGYKGCAACRRSKEKHKGHKAHKSHKPQKKEKCSLPPNFAGIAYCQRPEGEEPPNTGEPSDGNEPWVPDPGWDPVPDFDPVPVMP